MQSKAFGWELNGYPAATRGEAMVTTRFQKKNIIKIEIMAEDLFNKRINSKQVELGSRFAPKFDEDGLIPCITVDASTNEILMFAWMNREALELTIETGKAVYYSRSRDRIWEKGESSGRSQHVKEILVDCDQDVIQLRVDMEKPGSCHNGYKSCFYRKLDDGQKGNLIFVEDEPVFDPEKVYKEQNKNDSEM